jgi:tetratricopeptide (TPR) repeat protein
MRGCYGRLGVWVCLLSWFTVGVGRAGEVTQEEKDQVKEVARRLLAVAEPVPPFTWPPTFEIDGQDDVNASATATIKGEGEDAEVSPKVVIYKGLLDRVIRTPEKGSEDRLAYVLGHELSHILLGHVLQRRAGKAPLLREAFSRDDELAADLKGMELALKAGYSFRQARSALDRMLDLRPEYSSFEALQAGHPSWKDRLSFLDKDQAKLWKAMSAFDNGRYFLLCEQYGAAETCFNRVTREFPECPEAWTNLGYALLMQYCDGLDTDDLRDYDVGQIMVGGFYTRPKSLEIMVRGVDEKVWKASVAALEKALKLDPDLLLARANLGVAYLVHPSGTKDVKKASRYLQEAVAKAAEDKTLESAMRAAVLLNAGVADLAAGRVADAAEKFDQSEKIGRHHPPGGWKSPATLALDSALLYNRALMLAASTDADKRRAAVPYLEKYLQTASPSSNWWPLAYERYKKLSQESKLPVKGKKEFAQPNRAGLRPVTSVKLGSGVTIALTDRLRDIDGLGKGETVPVVAGTKLVRVRYPEARVEVLANGDGVLAIRLREPKAPPIPLQGKGLGAGKAELRVGMTKREFEQYLEDEDYDFRQLDDPAVSYRFYPALGVAARLQKNTVVELVVVQIPRSPGPGG